ncbi:MAG: hypothetical protein GX493_05970, partial [Firmicutes bacterium]|nr:hypothetical protein [Bacillota bacterium]
DLRQRLESLRQRNEVQGGGGGNSTGSGEGKLLLTGIVRYESLSLAVIVDGPRTYYVMPGERLGKTEYVLQSIGEASVVIAAGDKEEVLSLRRNKP